MMLHIGHKNCDSSWVFLVPNEKRASEDTLLGFAIKHFSVYCKDLVDAGIDMDKFYLIDAVDDYLVIK